MNISINRKNNRFSFSVGGFDSEKQYFIYPFLKSSYQYPWQAERDARILLKNYRTVFAEESDANEIATFENASAEEMLVSHYEKTYASISKKLAHSDKMEEDEKKTVYEEIKLITEGLLNVKDNLEEEKDQASIAKIINMFSKLTKEKLAHFLEEENTPDDALGGLPDGDIESLLAKKNDGITIIAMHKEKKDVYFSDDEIREIVEDYALRVCEAIKDVLPNCLYVIDKGLKKFDIVSADENERFIRVVVNDDMVIDKILPYKSLPSFSDVKFYSSYFKPICEKLGYGFFDNNVFVNPELPVVSNEECSCDIPCFSIPDKKNASLQITINPEKGIWKIQKGMGREASSKYSEEDYLSNGKGAIVRCTDQQLKSIYGKTGVVEQVIPNTDFVELDVDFGRHIVRLTESQIEIIHGI